MRKFQRIYYFFALIMETNICWLNFETMKNEKKIQKLLIKRKKETVQVRNLQNKQMNQK